MTPISNIKGKKACRVDLNHRTVEVVSKNYKVTVGFMDDGRVEVIRFNEDGSIADKQYLVPIA